MDNVELELSFAEIANPKISASKVQTRLVFPTIWLLDWKKYDELIVELYLGYHEAKSWAVRNRVATAAEARVDRDERMEIRKAFAEYVSATDIKAIADKVPETNGLNSSKLPQLVPPVVELIVTKHGVTTKGQLDQEIEMFGSATKGKQLELSTAAEHDSGGASRAKAGRDLMRLFEDLGTVGALVWLAMFLVIFYASARIGVHIGKYARRWIVGFLAVVLAVGFVAAACGFTAMFIAEKTKGETIHWNHSEPAAMIMLGLCCGIYTFLKNWGYDPNGKNVTPTKSKASAIVSLPKSEIAK